MFRLFRVMVTPPGIWIWVLIAGFSGSLIVGCPYCRIVPPQTVESCAVPVSQVEATLVALTRARAEAMDTAGDVTEEYAVFGPARSRMNPVLRIGGALTLSADW